MKRRTIAFCATVLTIVGCAAFLGLGAAGDADEISSVLALASFAPGLLVAALGLAREAGRRPFSLHLMHLLFVVCFFYLAAATQYAAGAFPLVEWLPTRMEDEDVLSLNVLLLVWFLVYSAGYRWLGRQRAPARHAKRFELSDVGLWVGFFVSIAALAYLASIGLWGLTTRGAYDALASGDDRSQFLLVSVFVRGVPVTASAAWLLAAIKAPRHRRIKYVLPLVVLVVLNLLTNNPLAAPRYWTATVGIAFVSIFFRSRKVATGGWLAVAVIAGLFIAMPLLDQGRSAESSEAYLESFAMESISRSFLDGDFDAYVTTGITEKYVSEHGASWGGQLVGVALFFVPRAVWPDKPVGSGFVVAEQAGLPNTNISSPLPAEGLMNFGVPGLVLFALAFGAILRRLDDAYQRQDLGFEGSGVGWWDVAYPFWLGLVFFVSRGDLLSSFAYAVGTTCSVLPLLVARVKRRDGMRVGSTPPISSDA